jgi:hypothetical protein
VKAATVGARNQLSKIPEKRPIYASAQTPSSQQQKQQQKKTLKLLLLLWISAGETLNLRENNAQISCKVL